MTSSRDIPDFDKFASLYSFDPKVLQSSDKQEQEVCNFILALSLVYNDLKDLLWAYKNLQVHRPAKFELTPEFGHLTGMTAHILRRIYATIHELFRLIAKNPTPQSHQTFQNVLNQLGKSN